MEIFRNFLYSEEGFPKLLSAFLPSFRIFSVKKMFRNVFKVRFCAYKFRNIFYSKNWGPDIFQSIKNVPRFI